MYNQAYVRINGPSVAVREKSRDFGQETRRVERWSPRGAPQNRGGEGPEDHKRPMFLIKLLLPRVQESLAAKLECREIHERERERIRVFLETFLIVNMLDEILKNYTKIQEIWQHVGDSEKRRN